MIRLCIALCVTLAAGPAFAGATAWQELASGASVRLISSDRMDGDTTLAGLELRLPPSTNTYWRIPGDSGIPTVLDLSGSSGVSDPQILWPFPSVEDTGGYRDFVYRDSVVLPMRLKASASGTLNVVASLGICSDICVPARAQLSLPLQPGRPDAANAIRLDQALADTPIPWDQPGPPFASLSLGQDASSLVIATPDAQIDADSLIVDAGDPSLSFAAPQKSPDGAIWTVKVSGGSGLSKLAGRPVQLTFMTSRGPYEVSGLVAAAAQ